jgi:DNA-directed RNA polymerase subunit K/omega
VTIPASSTLPTIPTRLITQSRAKQIQQEVHVLLYEDVTILASSTLLTIPTGPITQSRAKQIQQEVHALLYEF